MHDFESLLRSSLSEFARSLSTPPFWRARENECVNLFAHRFLFARMHPDGPLFNLAQIGIEVAVPQVPARSPTLGRLRRRDVRKDLVLWPCPEMHPFDRRFGPHWRLSEKAEERTPAAIVEWKVKTRDISPEDRAWLEDFTSCYRSTLGIAVSVDFTEHGASMRAIAVRAGVTQEDWLSV